VPENLHDLARLASTGSAFQLAFADNRPANGWTICCCRKHRFACAARVVRPAFFPWRRKQLSCSIIICDWSGRPTRPLLYSFLSRVRLAARMTPAGLRSLFRHHRQTSGVKIANPHRFRHTFASDMVRAGVSLPALMQLIGHANIQTTFVYLQVTPLEVYQQYARAIAQHIRPVPVTSS
jgi:Phage integrase family